MSFDDVKFDCDLNSLARCRTDGTHLVSTLNVYEAKDPLIADWVKVKFCKSHYTNYKLYGWEDVRFCNETIITVSKPTLIQVNGYNCKKCNEYHSYSAPNQSDGVTFICYRCRR